MQKEAQLIWDKDFPYAVAAHIWSSRYIFILQQYAGKKTYEKRLGGDDGIQVLQNE